MDAQVRDPSDADGSVTFYTKDVRVKADGDDGDDEATRIEVPVSGLAEDRDGDKLADSAIDSMVAQINEGGVPMFPNHGYDAENGVPQAYRFEDIIGGWTAAERDGDVVLAEAKLRQGHPSTADLKDLFAQDLPVGFSIGFGWDQEHAEERDGGGLRFDDLDMMEISPVGIQSHPDASTSDGGVKVASALREAGVDPNTLDHEALADQIIKMADKEDDENEEEEEQNAGGGGASQKVSGEEMDAIMNLVEGHMEALQEDLRDAIDVTDGGEESEEGDMDDEDEEEETDEYGEDDDEDKAAELEKELEEVRAELEAVKTDAAGSAGRKGGIETTEKNADGDDEQDEESETRAASVAEQAAEF